MLLFGRSRSSIVKACGYETTTTYIEPRCCDFIPTLLFSLPDDLPCTSECGLHRKVVNTFTARCIYICPLTAPIEVSPSRQQLKPAHRDWFGKIVPGLLRRINLLRPLCPYGRTLVSYIFLFSPLRCLCSLCSLRFSPPFLPSPFQLSVPFLSVLRHRDYLRGLGTAGSTSFPVSLPPVSFLTPVNLRPRPVDSCPCFPSYSPVRVASSLPRCGGSSLCGATRCSLPFPSPTPPGSATL